MDKYKQVSILTGHYGSGKTTIALNMAIDMRKCGKKVTIIDFDIVNPYFKTANFESLLKEKEIDIISPNFANTNLDIPSLPAEINRLFSASEDEFFILDLGGDDAGSIAIGGYAALISKMNYDMFYVINCCRYNTSNIKDSIQILKEIEISSRLKVTQLINNTNLGELTTIDTVVNSSSFVKTISDNLNLPIAFTAIDKNLSVGTDYYHIDVLVQKPW